MCSFKPSFVDPWERFSCIYLLMNDDVLHNNYVEVEEGAIFSVLFINEQHSSSISSQTDYHLEVC